MRVLDPVLFILRKKGSDVSSLPPDATVYSAMQMMADKDIGAVLVVDQDQLVGIVSERDYARKVILLFEGYSGERNHGIADCHRPRLLC